MPFQHLARLGKRKKPLCRPSPRSPVPPAPAAWPARVGDPGRGREEPDPREAAPAEALWLGGRRESGPFSASSAACGPGRIFQILSQARRKGRKFEKGAAFERVERRFRPAPGCPVAGSISVSLRKRCGWVLPGQEEGVRAPLVRQKAAVLGFASFQGLEGREGDANRLLASSLEICSAVVRWFASA